MKNFLIINPFGIGDVLFTTPVIRSIRDSYPGAKIAYWCNERVGPVLEANPCIDKVFALARGDIKRIFHESWIKGIGSLFGLINRIKKEQFDISLDFSLDHRYSLISKLSGVKKRVGFNYKGRGRFLTDKVDISGYDNKHVVEYYLGLLRLIGIKGGEVKLEMAIPQESRRKADELLGLEGVSAQDLLIGIGCGSGASWGKDARLKHWPEHNFAELADRITSDYAAKILILGDESDKQVSGSVLKQIHSDKVIDLTGKTDLGILGAVVNRLSLLVANDGGLLHIAVALGRKTVSFFGPTDPVVYGPYPAHDKRHIVLRRNLTCSPCYRKFRLGPCIKDKECLESIDVEEALGAVDKLLSA